MVRNEEKQRHVESWRGGQRETRGGEKLKKGRETKRCKENKRKM